MRRTVSGPIAGIVLTISVSAWPSMAEDSSFIACTLNKMRPEIAAGRVPQLDDMGEPASLIAVRAVQSCEAEGHVVKEGMRWRAVDWFIEWIFHVRQQANDHALEICGDSCSSEVFERAYSNALQQLAYRDGQSKNR